MELEYSETHYSIYQFDLGSELDWREIFSGECFLSVTRTSEEVSVVGMAESLAALPTGPVRKSDGWRMIRVSGTLDFSQIGILRELSASLADAGISIFVISTFDTDYLLIRGFEFEKAKLALQKSGHRLKPTGE